MRSLRASRSAGLRAEVDATQLARMRRELVPAAEVQAAVAVTLTVLRKEIMAIGTQVARLVDLDREVKVAIDEATREALRRAAATLTNPQTNQPARRFGGDPSDLAELPEVVLG